MCISGLPMSLLWVHHLVVIQPPSQCSLVLVKIPPFAHFLWHSLWGQTVHVPSNTFHVLVCTHPAELCNSRFFFVCVCGISLRHVGAFPQSKPTGYGRVTLQDSGPWKRTPHGHEVRGDTDQEDAVPSEMTARVKLQLTSAKASFTMALKCWTDAGKIMNYFVGPQRCREHTLRHG